MVRNLRAIVSDNDDQTADAAHKGGHQHVVLGIGDDLHVMGVRHDLSNPAPSDSDAGATAFGRLLGRRQHGRGPPKYYTIKAVAEAVACSDRTVRRWIANGYLVVHRVDGVVRVAEGDLRAFLALHREG